MRVRGQQLARSSRCGQLARSDLLTQLRQQRLQGWLRPEILFQTRVDPLPHPRQRLVLASVSKAAIGCLQSSELSDCHPKTVDALAQQGAQLHHLGVPLGVIGVRMPRAPVYA